MLIDEVKIKVRAGHGGPGAVLFNKIPGMQGPTGGNGGRGGSIIFKGVVDVFALKRYRFDKDFFAEDGKRGMSNLKAGGAGKDLELLVPMGTLIYEGEELLTEINSENKEFLIAKGGKGGRGNFEFRSATKTTPMYAQKGLPGDEKDLRLELQLIADVGLIGFPNAGKSSLLNEVTAAHAKIGSYPFTTLEPNLGVYIGTKEKNYGRHIVLADIPGLISGASKGKGLGIKFLKHIKRTRVLFHCLSCESKTPVKEYKVIRDELEKYDLDLSKKKEYLLLTKTDLISKERLKKLVTKMKKYNKDIYTVSVYDYDSIELLKDLLNKI
ncbi:MAG: GTPase ObgE [Candidatus Harrisonbacteria bacterium CG10_big_fil_rev_8_21_14_0_10_38_8]|uniref:GTPase Obg n=1 Tax=Candidatus Harrisonbacteria bacterium CG10_big_fil_rev_8_21_14_0_10_38_8 TaxID=1974582 RepID=A0A2M6WKF7_9BACT|nr:MAG: GTPase ObgE [Candidatus Harrisonbacteria bacterium CG10_big_fil_rev_8_21_14_0_10_38_8]